MTQCFDDEQQYEHENNILMCDSGNKPKLHEFRKMYPWYIKFLGSAILIYGCWYVFYFINE